MANTSATGGALSPLVTQAPLEGTSLTDFIQAWVASITGLPGASIFPRWQPEPPNLPAYGTDWAAFGIRSRDKDTYAAIVHDSAGNGVDELRRHETLDCLVSFYGQNAESYAELFTDGAQVEQNREALTAQSMALTNTDSPVLVPELVKERWLYRVDVSFSLRRQVVRQYPVLNVLSAQTVVEAEALNSVITDTVTSI